MRVVTWQTPSGDRIDITPDQERRLRAAGIWPRNVVGESYCQVYHGLHDGWPATDEQLGLADSCELGELRET